ncbi:hypothetical protein ACH6CV_12150 [Bacillota bacterium Meth-B3]
MNTELTISVLSLTGTLIGSIIGILTANRLSNYRIEALEQKMDKHNSIMERTALLERDTTTLFSRLEELRQDVKETRRHDDD